MSPRHAALAAVLILVLVLAAGVQAASARERIARVAVFPVENLSGGSVAGDEVRQFLVGSLASHGIAVLSDAALDEFMTRHRVRYAAGIDEETAQALRKEAGVDAVLFASFELSSTTPPPKVAVMARLVSIASVPAVVWADDAGLAGDDAPGFLELGLVNDYPELLARALNRLAGSLLAYLENGEARAAVKAAAKFRPKIAYRALTIEPGKAHTIAVVPFVNLSDRRNAGDILALLFIRHLSAVPLFNVVDPGVTRRQLLDARIIMNGGLSVSDAETVAALSDAEYVLGGRVMRYEDVEGPGGTPRVEFSAVLIEKKSRKVVWSSDSDNAGTDGVRFFGRGASRTAHTMATQMVGLTAEMIAGRSR